MFICPAGAAIFFSASYLVSTSNTRTARFARFIAVVNLSSATMVTILVASVFIGYFALAVTAKFGIFVVFCRSFLFALLA